MQTNDVELDADHNVQLETFGMIVGEVGSGEAQYLLHGERRLILESKRFIYLLFFHHYIFEIDQPKKLPEPLLNFILLSH